MLSTTVAQSTAELQLPVRQVYEYALTVVNSSDNDSHKLTAAFPFPPSLENWQNWLSGWNSCGYSLSSEPQLIQTL